MSENSAIEWTDATWNPVTGCTKISAGCVPENLVAHRREPDRVHTQIDLADGVRVALIIH
jgi:protein gp37